MHNVKLHDIDIYTIYDYPRTYLADAPHEFHFCTAYSCMSVLADK